MSELIVKDNGLIQASYSLGLAEQRLILLAIVEARRSGKGLTKGSLLAVHAKDYAKQYHTDIDTAYQVLKDTAKLLMTKLIHYEAKSPMTGRLIQFVEPWANKSAYEPDLGYVYIRFSDVVVPLITRLESQFTSYKIDNVSNLSSRFAIRLYELIIQWRDKGLTQKFSIEDLRRKLGVEENQYKELYNLKARVIDIAIKQINIHTDVKVKYNQFKEGRTVAYMSFSFSFKQNKIAKQIAKPDKFIKFSPKQLDLFSHKLAKLNELGSDAPIGGTTEQYATIIANDLADSVGQVKYIKHLEKLGFKLNKDK